MVWSQLDINRPHLVYILLGAFTSLFMLCSSVIKERLYIGEATVATLFGIMFGPHAANLIDPGTWGNTDQITLEFARIVLVVQCFAVGVELPKAYMERHWKSVLFLLVPVMTFGWLITSVFIWGLVPGLDWLDSLCVAACVTATDPVLASSVVGKGKFAQRIPRHLRDLLSAESGCNDGMAFPFIYLALYLIKYRPDSNQVSFHWFCFTILYECVFGAFYGFVIGYLARRAIRYAHEHDIIDRESFLVFYFVLALFCAGSGSMLGMDDLLIGFACGVGFSNDGWFTEKTVQSHVSNVIDLLLNLSFFVYFGTIIPWQQYNAGIMGLTAWRLVVIGILVMMFRRIPVMLALKPFIPDVKTWREALFAGHFGPIGVGAIFVAILARAELETDTTTPLTVLPKPDFPHSNIITLIWPITSFLVICSILVHGSSIAVFTLGKHINTFTLTMSYTTQNESTWLDRLPRIQSRSKSSMSLRRPDEAELFGEKLPGDALPKNFLRRQREEDDPAGTTSGRRRRGSRSYSNDKHGGPITPSAIGNLHTLKHEDSRPNASDSDTLAVASEEVSPDASFSKGDKTKETQKNNNDSDNEGEIYEEGHETVYEDSKGNVLKVEDEDPNLSDQQRHDHEVDEARRLMKIESEKRRQAGEKQTGQAEDDNPDAAVEPTDVQVQSSRWRKQLKRMGSTTRTEQLQGAEHEGKKKRVPACAYQFGNTVVIEDEDGEVIKKFEVKRSAGLEQAKSRRRVQKMGEYLGIGQRAGQESVEGTDRPDSNAADTRRGKRKETADSADDPNLRFTLCAGGRRMNVVEFMDEIKKMEPRSRAKFVEQSNAPEEVKREARADAEAHSAIRALASRPKVKLTPSSPIDKGENEDDGDVTAEIRKVTSNESVPRGPDGLTLVDSNNRNVPFHDVTRDLQTTSRLENSPQRQKRSAALRARQQAAEDSQDSEDDGTPRIPPAPYRRSPSEERREQNTNDDVENETAAERRRREGALGISNSNDSDEDEDRGERLSLPRRPQPAHRQRIPTDSDTDPETAAEARRRTAALGVSTEDGIDSGSDRERDVSASASVSESTEQSRGPSVTRPTGIRFADEVSTSRTGSESGSRRHRRSFGRHG